MKRRSFIQSIAALSAASLPTLPCLGSLTRPSKKVESVFDLFRTVETNDLLDQWHVHEYKKDLIWIPFNKYKQKVDWNVASINRCGYGGMIQNRSLEILNSSIDKAHEYALLKLLLAAGVDRGIVLRGLKGTWSNIHALKDYIIFGSPELKEKYPDIDIIDVDELGEGQMFQRYYDEELKGISSGEIAIAVKPDPDIFLTFQPKYGVRQFGHNVDLGVEDGKISKRFDFGRRSMAGHDFITAMQVTGSVILDSRNVCIIGDVI